MCPNRPPSLYIHMKHIWNREKHSWAHALFELLQAPLGGIESPPPLPRPRTAAHRLRDAHRDTFSTSHQQFPPFNASRVANTQSFRHGTDSQTFGGLRERCSLPPHPADAGLRAPAHRGAGRNPAPSRDAAAAWAAGLRTLMSVLQYVHGPWAMRYQCF